MFKVVAKTRKGGAKKILLKKVDEKTAKDFVRDRDWFYVDDMNRFYDLYVEPWKG